MVALEKVVVVVDVVLFGVRLILILFQLYYSYIILLLKKPSPCSDNVTLANDVLGISVPDVNHSISIARNVCNFVPAKHCFIPSLFCSNEIHYLYGKVMKNEIGGYFSKLNTM